MEICQDSLSPRLRTGTLSFLPHFLGKLSHIQEPRSKKQENILSVKEICCKAVRQRVWTQGPVNNLGLLMQPSSLVVTD